MKSLFLKCIVIILISSLLSCDNSTKVNQDISAETTVADQDAVKKLIESFILAESGSTLNIPAGHFELETQLIIDNLSNLKIIGAGMDETFLSFKNLKSGGEGVKVVGQNITLQDFTVLDAPGDGIKTQHCDTIIFRKVNATWTNGDKSKNGTYAIYPVQCKNVIIDQCKASHSRDAGIYVGQSENIIVKNCEAFGNVAGIEIENCTNAEVFDNKVYDNAGGILVFNLPNLPVADGSRTKIYNNEILENNHINFAIPISDSPNGNTVTMIPPGSGVILLAAKEVEVFNNKILNNKTSGLTVANYHITEFPMDAPNWSPFSSNISVHDNEYKRPMTPPDMSKDLGKLVAAKNAHGIGKSQDIVYDGFFDKTISKSIHDNPMNICIKESSIESLHFTLFDLYEGQSNIKAFKDYAPFVCQKSVETDITAIKNL